ncbi:MAG: hypothetical protein Q8R24_07470 [Legionellaceae bacterium]|nr:hypothetical protein [Legionellaceae bacterium]
MKNVFTVSQQTLELMQELRERDADSSLLSNLQGDPQHLTCHDVINKLMEREQSLLASDVFHKTRFFQESLRIAWLRDLSLSYYGVENVVEPFSEEDTSWLGKIQLTALAFAGTIYTICSGFDGSTSILSLFIGIPNWTVFVVALALSLVLVVLFYSFDLVDISENIRVRLFHSRQLLDVYLEQAGLINKLIEQSKQRMQDMNNELVNELSIALSNAPLVCDRPRSGRDQDLADVVELWNMLIARQEDLCLVRQIYLQELEHRYVRAMKFMATTIAGLLYFNCGFFAGQILAVAVLSVFLTASISITSWPVLLISISVGLAALSIFWYNGERSRVENLAGKWLGLDQDKINCLPVNEHVVKQKTEQNQLEQQIRLHKRFLIWNDNDSSNDAVNWTLDKTACKKTHAILSKVQC